MAPTQAIVGPTPAGITNGMVTPVIEHREFQSERPSSASGWLSRWRIFYIVPTGWIGGGQADFQSLIQLITDTVAQQHGTPSVGLVQ